jgi:hypothetical protein
MVRRLGTGDVRGATLELCFDFISVLSLAANSAFFGGMIAAAAFSHQDN